MKISFFWAFLDGDVSPFCESSFLSEDGVDILSCLLTNDGGLGYLKSISWLDEGVQRLSSVRKGEKTSIDWEREDWGAKFDASNVLIYSLYDEACFVSLSLEIFEKVLSSWRDFLSEGPMLGRKVVLDVS